jgi:hypothetical protein
MAAYAVSAILQDGVAYQAPPLHRGRAEELLSRLSEADESGPPPAGGEAMDLVGRPIDEAIGEWLASVGESWSQLTFFLFDPDSWR